MTVGISPTCAVPAEPRGLAASLAAGFRTSWLTALLIAAINTGIAAVLWVDDTRPFWHPLWTCQLYGFSIAYCVNAAQPWNRTRPILTLALAVVAGALVGVLLVIVTKGYAWSGVVEHRAQFLWNIATAIWTGGFVSLFFHIKEREARRKAALAEADAARHLASRQVVEAELKMLQAQGEPHFLFNTLASVQYLVETDPPQASKLLTHLTDYLRAALPQLRSPGTTLGREFELARAYLEILQMRMGARLAFTVDLPADLADHPFPPVMLITLVENAIRHGVEPAADGGRVAVAARRLGDQLAVEVADTGCGVDAPGASPGHGVGLANLRQRLAALFGREASFGLAPAAPRGTVATLRIPYVTP